MPKARALVPFILGLLACTPEPPPLPPKAPPAAPPPAASTAQPAPPAQRFAEHALVPAFTDPARRDKLASSFPALDAMVDAELQRLGIPSVAVGVVIDGDLAHFKGAGFSDVDKKIAPDADTIYRIGSIGKSFTSMALLSLRDEGALGLDDPLVRFVPEASGLVYPTRDEAPITLRQLVSHTAGLPGNGAFELGNDTTEATILASIQGFSLEAPPGTTFHYSNLGMVLAGIAVSHASHTSLRDLVKKRIFSPLGMTSSSWDRQDLPEARIAVGYGPPGPDGKPAIPPQWRVGDTAGAGGIYSSVRDMARYLAFQLSAYPPREGADAGPIKRSTVREAHATGFHAELKVELARVIEPGEPLVDAVSNAYGFGWASSQTCNFGHLVGHTGGMPGFVADVEFLPDHGVGLVVLANGPRNLDGLVKKALRVLAKSGGLSPRQAPPSPALVAAMSKLTAVYNAWDEAAYKAMLSAGRPSIPEEKDELAGYRALHGACKDPKAIEVISPFEARFGLTCDRGRFDMKINISPASGGIDGFVGTSHDVDVPADRKKTIDAVIGLIGKWDEKVWKAHLAKSGKSVDEGRALFARLRGDHDRCSLGAATHEGFDTTYALVCARGPRVSLAMETDPKDPKTVAAFGFQEGGTGTCPVR